MKRLLSLSLVLALLLAAGLPAALAEEAEVFSEMVEPEVALATDAGDTGLTVEGVEEAPVVEAAPADGEAAPGESEATDDGEQAVAAPEEIATAAATGLALNAESITIGAKETYTLVAVALPVGSAMPAVTWRSDNEKYVTVDATGKVTGVKKGSANVFAAMPNGKEVSCKVTVLKAPGRLNVSPSKLTLAADGESAQLKFTVPKGAASNTFTYASSNPQVATVDASGVITTVGAGKATITVKAYNGKGGKCKLTVTPSPASIAFPNAELSFAVGQKLTLKPTVTLSNGKTGSAAVTFAIGANSRDAGCVSLDAKTGELTGVRKGSAVITATTYNGKTATLPVTVAAAPTSISLSDDAVSIGTKDIYSGLLADLGVPAGETECATTVTWTTSNKKVATVDANGIITGHKKGNCVITATTVNGLKDSCKVYVYKAPKKVTLSPASGTLKVGETGQYRVGFPKGTGGTVRFDTSDASVATIDDDGVVTAVAPGTATITVTCFNGKTAKAKLEVTTTDAGIPPTEYDSIESDTDHYSDDMTNAQKLEYVIYVAQSQKNKPYKYGGGYTKDENPSGFDCSGLVYWSFLHIGIKVQASAYRQGYDDSMPKITNMANLKRGDIVCFDTNENDSDKSDHTGIYLGNGKFIHASSSAKKVVVSTLAEGYYNRTFSWGRRVLQ